MITIMNIEIYINIYCIIMYIRVSNKDPIVFVYNTLTIKRSLIEQMYWKSLFFYFLIFIYLFNYNFDNSIIFNFTDKKTEKCKKKMIDLYNL